MTPEVGRLYEFVLSDGRLIVLRYEGMGNWMKTLWVDPKTDKVIELPPYKSYRQLN